MTFDPTKPVQTRDGRKARIICTDLRHPWYSMAVAIADENGLETISCYSKSGRWDERYDDENSLVNIPEKRKYWVVMAKECGLPMSGTYCDKGYMEEAVKQRKKSGIYIATHEGEYEV